MYDFDDLDDDSESAAVQTPVLNINMLPIEHRPLPLPSYQNCEDPNAIIELEWRQKQADRILDSIRSTIAEKSFQYSHVLRVAPRKSVQTRARAAIAKMNSLIATYAESYSRCRLAMIRLDAEGKILERYQVLTRGDLKASTALIDPNKPGASQMRLSWIWKGLEQLLVDSSDCILECTFKMF